MTSGDEDDSDYLSGRKQYCWIGILKLNYEAIASIL